MEAKLEKNTQRGGCSFIEKISKEFNLVAPKSSCRLMFTVVLLDPQLECRSWPEIKSIIGRDGGGAFVQIDTIKHRWKEIRKDFSSGKTILSCFSLEDWKR